MASPTQWTWVWVNSRSWRWTGKPGVLRFMGFQRVGRDWATELNWWPRAQLYFVIIYWQIRLVVTVQVLRLESWWSCSCHRNQFQRDRHLVPQPSSQAVPKHSISVSHSCGCHFSHQADQKSQPGHLLEGPSHPRLLQDRYHCAWPVACAGTRGFSVGSNLHMCRPTVAVLRYRLTSLEKIKFKSKVISRQGNSASNQSWGPCQHTILHNCSGHPESQLCRWAELPRNT